MALIALGTESPVMTIIDAVATHAGGGQAHAALDRVTVAGVAVNLAVGAVEWKFGLPVVIEVPDLPVAGVVAGLAQDAAPPLVLVFALVAGNAIALSVLEPRRFVALLAVGSKMAAGEREPRAAVVKTGGFPVLGAVAVAALLPLLPLVDVILLVAREAVRRRALEICVAVAVLALGSQVFGE